MAADIAKLLGARKRMSANRGGKKVGAERVVATEVVAKAAPDGYVLLSAYGSHMINDSGWMFEFHAMQVRR